MIYLVVRGPVGPEHLFEAVVETFHQAVSLWMVGYMFSRLYKAANMEEVNWALQSDVMTAWTLNLLCAHPPLKQGICAV
jgi:hypothetical protein